MDQRVSTTMARIGRVGIALGLAAAGWSGGSRHASASGELSGVAALMAAPTAVASPAPCPTGTFLANLPANPANVGFPAPSVLVTCTDTRVTVRTNAIPTFAFVARTPNPLRTQDLTFRFPRVPVAASTPGALALGVIGMAVDGLPIYGPFEAPAHGSADPAADGILDACGGHTGPAGEYHVHATSACLPSGLMGMPGAIVGYALDGYPIVSPVTCTDDACTSTRTARSSWAQVSTARSAWSRYAFQEGTGDLDRCNGMTGPDGQYRYVAVSSFPYFLGCYHGEVAATTGGPGASAGAGRARGAAPEASMLPGRQAVPPGRPEPGGKQAVPPTPVRPMPLRPRR